MTEPEPLEPELQTALRAAFADEALDAQVRAELRADLRRAFGAPSAPVATSAGKFGRLARWARAAALVSIGGVAGALAHAQLAGPGERAREVLVSAPAPAPIPIAPSAPLPLGTAGLLPPPLPVQAAPETPRERANVPAGSASPAARGSAPILPPPPAASTAESPGVPAPAPPTTLSAERALVSQAQNALDRGDSLSALDALQRHRIRFVDGQLAEERDALTVQALVVGGRVQDARRRAALFHAAHPGSVFGPAVDAAVRSIP